MELDPDVRAYYDRGREARRLHGGFPSGPLERARTQELMLRHLPAGELRILDVGGGAGVYARWLMDLGHTVRLVEPVPLHVEQATEAGIDAELGDARALEHEDASVDVVLSLGPLYHLLEASDRQLALREAHRVLRPGGTLFAAAISRFAALFDLLVFDKLDAELLPLVVEAVETGAFRGGTRAFTNAYFHLPSELEHELETSGFGSVEVFGIEGPSALVQHFEDRWSDPGRREVLLAAARLVESEPEVRGASSHLLAVASEPG